MKKNKNKMKPNITLLVYFSMSILTLVIGAALFGYLAYLSVGDELAWFFVFMCIGCLICLAGLLFYNKIFVDHPAEILETGIKIGKKVTRWEDIEKVWPETIWTGRGEPHLFACFRIKDEARKKKPKNARFDFRIPVNDENLLLIERYMKEDQNQVSRECQGDGSLDTDTIQ